MAMEHEGLADDEEEGGGAFGSMAAKAFRWSSSGEALGVDGDDGAPTAAAQSTMVHLGDGGEELQSPMK